MELIPVDYGDNANTAIQLLSSMVGLRGHARFRKVVGR